MTNAKIQALYDGKNEASEIRRKLKEVEEKNAILQAEIIDEIGVNGEFSNKTWEIFTELRTRKAYTVAEGTTQSIKIRKK